METLDYAYEVFPRDLNLDFHECQLAVLSPADVILPLGEFHQYCPPRFPGEEFLPNIS